jgi:hypothetical protein
VGSATRLRFLAGVADPRTSQIVQYLDQIHLRNRSERVRSNSLQLSRLWLAPDNVVFQGLEAYSGTSSNFRMIMRGDIPVTQFLRLLVQKAKDEDLWRQLLVFSSLFVASMDLSSETKIGILNSQLRRIEGDLGETFGQSRDQFFQAIDGSPTAIFDTTVWSHRDIGRL